MKKTNPSFNSPSPFSLSNPFFAQTITVVIVIAVHCDDRQQRMQPALSRPPSPLPRNEETTNNQSSLSSWQLKLLSAYAMLPPPTHRCCPRHHHAAAAFPNALLLPLKITLLPSCHFCCQAGRHHHAAAATTSANARQPPCYHCLQNKNVILLTNLSFTTMVMAACSDNGGATRQQR